MQSIKQLLTIFLTVTFLMACGGKDKKTADADGDTTTKEVVKTEESGTATKLEGAWEIKRAEGSMAETNVGTVYEFKGSKLSFGKGGYTNPGSTVVTDSTFSFQADGNELKFMYNYKFNGDTLVIEMQKSGGQIFHLVKK
jgi:hypothetical protein